MPLYNNDTSKVKAKFIKVPWTRLCFLAEAKPREIAFLIATNVTHFRRNFYNFVLLSPVVLL